MSLRDNLSDSDAALAQAIGTQVRLALLEDRQIRAGLKPEVTEEEVLVMQQPTEW